MKPQALHDQFRSEVFDLRLPYLWSDPEIYGFLDSAQKQFCRLAGGLLDSLSDVTQVEVSAGEPWAVYDPRILTITYANLLSDASPVEITTIDKLSRLGAGDDYGYTRRFRLDTRQGPVRYALINMEANALRLVAVPAVNDTLLLTVYRLPLTGIATTGTGTLEVDEMHHEFLLLWMKHRAYSKQDADCRDDKKAADFKLSFEQYCDQARKDRERREHSPREIGYGGL